MRLDIDSLRAFRAIVEAGSFTGAASRLHLTQSAVSWKMKRLEERLGHALLIRSTGSIELTAVGSELLAHAERILDAHDDAVASLELSELSGVVRLGCNDYPELDDVAGTIRRYLSRNPKVRVHTRIALSTILRNWLVSGELDLALIQLFRDEVGENDTVLWADEMVWIASPDLTPDADGRMPIVTFGKHGFYRPVIEQRLEQAGIESYVALECESSHGVVGAVQAGLGLGVINRRVADGCEVSDVDDLTLPDDLPEVVFTVRRSARSRDAAVRGLQHEIVDAFREAGVAER